MIYLSCNEALYRVCEHDDQCKEKPCSVGNWVHSTVVIEEVTWRMCSHTAELKTLITPWDQPSQLLPYQQTSISPSSPPTPPSLPSPPPPPFLLLLTPLTLSVSQGSEKASQTKDNAKDKAGGDRDVRDNTESWDGTTSEGAIDEVSVVVTDKGCRGKVKIHY